MRTALDQELEVFIDQLVELAADGERLLNSGVDVLTFSDEWRDRSLALNKREEELRGRAKTEFRTRVVTVEESKRRTADVTEALTLMRGVHSKILAALRDKERGFKAAGILRGVEPGYASVLENLEKMVSLVTQFVTTADEQGLIEPGDTLREDAAAFVSRAGAFTRSQDSAIKELARLLSEKAITVEALELRAQALVAETRALEAEGKALNDRCQRLMPKVVTEHDFAAGSGKLSNKLQAQHTSVKDLVEQLENNVPELFQMLYPRMYGALGEHYSPKLFAAAAAQQLIHVAHVGLDKAPTATRLMLPGLKFMMDQKMPMLFLERAFLEAVQRTDFDGDIDWTELKLPYEHGVLVLPKGALVAPGDDGDVGFIFYSRLKEGVYQPPIYGVPSMQTITTSFSIVALCPTSGIWYDSNLTIKRCPTLRLHNLFYREDPTQPLGPGDTDVPGEPVLLSSSSEFDEKELTTADAAFLEKIGVVVFGSMLALRARPALLTPAKLLTVAKNTKKGTRREFWDPTYIGKGYYPKREPGLGGSHASPRMHWRRGHFRHQAYGVGRSERKVIWLEPTLVSANVIQEKSHAV